MRTILQFAVPNEKDVPDMLRRIADAIEDGDEHDIDGLKIAIGNGVSIDPRLTMAAANLMMAFDLPQPAEEAMTQMLYACMIHPDLTTADIGLQEKESMNSMSRASMIAKAKSLIAEVEAKS